VWGDAEGAAGEGAGEARGYASYPGTRYTGKDKGGTQIKRLEGRGRRE
jgi:hypothetical protein